MARSVLGRAIKVKRAAEDLYQEQLADKLGVSVKTIAHAEGGGRPSNMTAQKLAEWLGYTVEEVQAAAARPVGGDE